MGEEIGKDKPRHFKKNALRLLTYLRPYKVRLTMILLFAVLSTIFAVFAPTVLGKITSHLFEQVSSSSPIDFSYIGKIVLILGGLYLGSSVFNFIQGFLMSRITRNVTVKIRSEVDAKLHRVPLRYHDQNTTGDLLSRIVNDVDLISETIDSSMTQMITSIVTIIGILVMMLRIHWLLSIVAFLVLPISLFLMSFFINKSQKYFDRQQSDLGHLNAHVEEMYTGHEVVKAFHREKKSIHQFDTINEQLYEAGWKSQFLSGLMMPIINFVGNLGYVFICLLGGYFVLKGRIKVGEIQAFIQYIRRFHAPIVQIADIANVLQSTVAAAERIFTLLDEGEETETKETVALDTVQGAVSFQHVDFGYVKGKTIIHDFSIDIAPGTRVAIVGPTGAGKTTMVNLLMRFYDPTGGKITIDGVDITKLSRHTLRSFIGMVLQDTWVFHGTIRENLAYGKLDASFEEIQKAAKESYADHFIRLLPDGYDTVLNEETTNLSGGEKQLLTIARCFLIDPEILILDEATSSIDTRTEQLIEQAMERLMEGKTCFVIAHRLSTIKESDVIIVMRDGNIVEVGNHQTLLQQNGFYASLYNSQFE